VFRRASGSGDDLRRLLAGAATVARSRGDEQIEVEHLLLGALTEPNSEASRTLAAIGVDPKAVVDDLTSALDAQRRR
jgi:ATP-dependent Clp protease ATP-binding subunit ClpA